MKYRSDFVTNSSSSSFIVALRKGTKREEVELLVKRVVADLNLEDLYIEADETEEAISEIVELMFDWPLKYGVEMDGVISFSCEVGNEGDPGRRILYECAPEFNAEFVKTRLFC